MRKSTILGIACCILLIGISGASLSLSAQKKEKPPATPSSPSKPAKERLKYDSINDLIDFVTVMSLERSLSQSSGFKNGEYKLSPRLVELKRRFHIGDCAVFLPPGAIFGTWDDRVSMMPGRNDQWIALAISCSKAEFPEFRFTKGEIGIRKGDTYVTEGTQIWVDGKIYSFISGKWNVAEQSASQKEGGQAKPAKE